MELNWQWKFPQEIKKKKKKDEPYKNPATNLYYFFQSTLGFRKPLRALFFNALISSSDSESLERFSGVSRVFLFFDWNFLSIVSTSVSYLKNKIIRKVMIAAATDVVTFENIQYIVLYCTRACQGVRNFSFLENLIIWKIPNWTYPNRQFVLKKNKWDYWLNIRVQQLENPNLDIKKHFPSNIQKTTTLIGPMYKDFFSIKEWILKYLKRNKNILFIT